MIELPCNTLREIVSERVFAMNTRGKSRDRDQRAQALCYVNSDQAYFLSALFAPPQSDVMSACLHPPTDADGRAHSRQPARLSHSLLHLLFHSPERLTAGSMSGWGDTLIGSKFESVVDQSTGETIMVSPHAHPHTLPLSIPRPLPPPLFLSPAVAVADACELSAWSVPG